MTRIANFDDLLQDALSMPFSGWDFSIIADRWKTHPPSWDYASIARQHMQGITAMLDLDTGGGEFLSSLAPFPPSTWATESYPPNIPVATARLQPLGVKIIDSSTSNAIPLPDMSLDLILNRHGVVDAPEFMRLLIPNGVFLTQQVGGQNCLRINELLQDEVDFKYSFWSKEVISQQLRQAGFEIIILREEFPMAEFTDVGALVFYLRIISWQVEDFSVEKYYVRLRDIHENILAKGPLVVHEHRILVEARKPFSHHSLITEK